MNRRTDDDTDRWRAWWLCPAAIAASICYPAFIGGTAADLIVTPIIVCLIVLSLWLLAGEEKL